jgi:N6-adenosine-specific RNA methylase IME4
MYNTLMVDPPWQYDDRAASKGGSTGGQYPTMRMEELRSMWWWVDDLANTPAWMWMWTTNSFMEEALWLAKQWGFDQKTILTWVKTKRPISKNLFTGYKEIAPMKGTGHYLLNGTEHCLVCTRGAGASGMRKRFDTPTVVFGPITGRHSEKPQYLYDFVQEVSPGPYLDIFTRRIIPEWDGWGRDYPKKGAGPICPSGKIWTYDDCRIDDADGNILED